ncbi:CbiX/SirB N-terminal domain-containing protein [Antrihabitans stalactiti]|uniref:Sirohydrochlorin chelatase n=1 Tax=Antrihabitans stalactiti TaxID=2584121 RepID=A0A848KEP4_9NOCA|nr:sirohydrochlorin chelatase [Antrihabitans stalactiti]
MRESYPSGGKTRAQGAAQPLIAVAHGSRDPRSAATIHAAVEQIRIARPDLDVRLAFLDLNAPSIDCVVDGVVADGYREAVVVPLLLGSAFHARVDLPAILARHSRLSLTQSDVLGSDPLLVDAVRDRILEAGVDLDDETVGVAVAAVGSSSASANHKTDGIARLVAQGTAWTAKTCFATTEPGVTDAVASLRAAGAQRIVVAPWFLAPGLLTDRVTALSPNTLHANTIGTHPALAEVAIARYDRALAELADRISA